MADTVVESLILDLLEWLATADRSYEEAMDAWRTSCPKLPVWEEANDRGLVIREDLNGRCVIRITSLGRACLEQQGRQRKGTCTTKRRERFSEHKMLFALQVYEKVSASSLNGIGTRLDWTELRIYDINEGGRNHGVLLGTKGWAPRSITNVARHQR